MADPMARGRSHHTIFSESCRASMMSSMSQCPNFDQHSFAMDIALKKLDLIQRLMQVWDEAALQRIAKTIEEEVPEADMDMSDEDWAELERRRAEHLRGEGKSYTKEEAMSLLRAARK